MDAASTHGACHGPISIAIHYSVTNEATAEEVIAGIYEAEPAKNS
jgi:hypothetical protein